MDFNLFEGWRTMSILKMIVLLEVVKSLYEMNIVYSGSVIAVRLRKVAIIEELYL
jgi:hypothetical protein